MFLLLPDNLFFWDLNFLYCGFYGFLFAGLWFRDFFNNRDAKREIKDRAGPYGEFFEKVLDVGHSY